MMVICKNIGTGKCASTRCSHAIPHEKTLECKLYPCISIAPRRYFVKIYPHENDMVFGKYCIRSASLAPERFYIRHESGEAGLFLISEFEKVIDKFFNDNY